MEASIIYAFFIWIAQVVFYLIITFNLIELQIKKRKILLIAVILLLIGPMLFPLNVVTANENYICGLGYIAQLFFLWIIGGCVSLILVLVFEGIRFIKNKRIPKSL